MEEFTVSKITALTLQQRQELLHLFVDADFVLPDEGSDWLDSAIRGSLLAAGVFTASGELIGFARALGDGVSDCYIQDVTIRRDFRQLGLGSKLMDFMLTALAEQNIDWVGLIATPGKADFYRQLGFEVLENHTPMILKRSPVQQ